MVKGIKTPIIIGLIYLTLVLAGILGFLTGQHQTQVTVTTTTLYPITATVTHLKTSPIMVVETTVISLTKTSTTIRTETVTNVEPLFLQISAQPILKRIGDRWILFNVTIRVKPVSGKPAEALSLVFDGIERKIEQGSVEVSDIGPGLHRIVIKGVGWTWERVLEIGFPDLEPDISYAELVTGGRRTPVTFVAAYYGWYSLGDLNWRNWGDPENPATKYLPLLAQFSGDPISQKYSLYGFGLDEGRNVRLVKRQMVLAKMAGISAFAVSWWGPDSFEDRFMPTILKAAEEVGFKVTVIFEPFYKNFPDRWRKVEEAINYLESRYIASNVWLRDTNNLPVVFTFDIGSPEDWESWKNILSRRSMAWVAHTTDRRALDYGFKYFYEYSPVGIVVAGGDITQVYMGVSDIPPYDKQFIPTISPRYDDTKVRAPGIKMGEELWKNSIAATKTVITQRRPQFVFVTSWNEWHESTSVEPSTSDGFKFLSDFRREFYGETLLDEHFLKALNVFNCIKFCKIPLTP
jgi:glycoprotein endo-alpha-1,2-mannosidase